MGFDVDAFTTILHVFAPIFNKYTTFNNDGSIIPLTTTTGPRRLFQLEDCIALVFGWTRTRGSVITLQLIFGMTMSNLSMYLCFGQCFMIHALISDPHTSLQIPSEEKITEFTAAINTKYPILKDLWATMDGLKLYFQKSPN